MKLKPRIMKVLVLAVTFPTGEVKNVHFVSWVSEKILRIES